MSQPNFPASYLTSEADRVAWATIETLTPIVSIEATLSDHTELVQALGIVAFSEATLAVNQTDRIIDDRSYADVALDDTDSIIDIAREYATSICRCIEAFNEGVDSIERGFASIDDSLEYAFAAQMIYHAAEHIANNGVYVINIVNSEVQEIESGSCGCDGKGHLVAIIRANQAINILLETLTAIASAARIVRFLMNSFRIPVDEHRLMYGYVLRDMQIKRNLPSIWEIHEEIAMKLFHPDRIEEFLETCDDPLEYLA